MEASSLNLPRNSHKKIHFILNILNFFNDFTARAKMDNFSGLESSRTQLKPHSLFKARNKF